ncbi:MAG TPA: restriction endonuclease [Burkholderiales bacterium]
MNWQLPRNSFFAILARQPWWVSALIALGTFGGLRLLIPEEMALFSAVPFAGIAIYALIQQLRRPGAKRIAKTLERARGLSGEGFVSALETGFRREGYDVTRMNGGADLVLKREGLTTLVACKRWKAMRAGIEPLREFDAATRVHGPVGRIYIAAGEVTENALAFANERNIRLVREEELARLLR